MQETKVTGDWREDREPIRAYVYPGEHWNGFAVPFFAKAEAEQIVREQDEAHAEDPEGTPQTMRWDGDRIVLHSADYAYEPGYEDEVIEPTSEGLYDLSNGWTWYEDDGAELVCAVCGSALDEAGVSINCSDGKE